MKLTPAEDLAEKRERSYEVTFEDYDCEEFRQPGVYELHAFMMWVVEEDPSDPFTKSKVYHVFDKKLWTIWGASALSSGCAK